jgi:hypothetical protein
MLGLDPDRVIARVREDGRPVALPTLSQSVLVGTLGFAMVSIVAFSIWAVGGHALARALGPGFYALIAVVLLVGGALIFKPIIIGRNLVRFAVLFALGFVLLSGVWIAGYLSRLPHRLGEWTGVVLGPATLAGTLCLGFRARLQMVRCVGLLVISHTGAYLCGDLLFSLPALQNQYGMLLWGVVYGAGFGAGISLTLYYCQEETRRRLVALVESNGPLAEDT